MDSEQSSDFIKRGETTDAELLEQFGSTSLAYKIRLNGQVRFMKKLRPELRNDGRYRDLFYKEFNTGKRISSPYIVKYLDIKDDADGLCILMEYVNGHTLKQKIDNNPEYFRHKENINKLLLQLCEALKTLHNENIVHLDINPSNIIITQTSNNIKLVDFGFCLSDWDDQTAGTTTNFGAPEATMNEIKQIDARTDIYSIGRILQYIEEKSGAKFTPRIRRIKKRCLCKHKAQRYSSAAEIIEEIAKYRIRKWVIAASVVVATILLTLFTTKAYKALDNYIAWERGEIAEKFEEGGIFYRITDHKARTVAVTYKGNHDSEYMFEYKEGVIELPPTVTHRGRRFRVTSIDSYSFDNPETTGIILPDGLESISNMAFVVCRLTGEVYIPKSIRHIGVWTFEGNTHIDGFVVDEANPVFDSRGGCNAIIETARNRLVVACANTVIPNDITTIGMNAFTLYQKPHITLPQSVTTIEGYAFGQSALTEITLPSNITEIGAQAFENCKKLKKIVSHIPPEKLQPTGDFCFNGVPEDCILYVPRGAKSTYMNTNGWNSFNNIIEM